MRNSFNLLLIALICFDSWYLFGSILESFRRIFHLDTELHTLLFPYILYPLQFISMAGSIFMTVGISLERYIAVHYPIGEWTVSEYFRYWVNSRGQGFKKELELFAWTNLYNQYLGRSNFCLKPKELTKKGLCDKRIITMFTLELNLRNAFCESGRILFRKRTLKNEIFWFAIWRNQRLLKP